APNGYYFENHATDPKLAELIKSKTWDIVVLQEQSQRPDWPQPQMEQMVFPYAKILARKIRENNPQAKIIFYETMAHKTGDAANISAVAEVATYEGMQHRINVAYEKMAKDNDALLAPV